MDTFFLLLGAQKAGTSWLGRVLSEHSDVFMPRIQEIHYFDSKHGFYDKNDTLRDRLSYVKQRLARVRTMQAQSRDELTALQTQVEALIEIDSDHAYRAFFDRFGDSHKVCGEKTPNYCVLPQSIFDEMAGIFPDTRLLFILRNPVDRFWSQYRFHADRVANSGRKLPAFSDPLMALRQTPFASKSNYPEVMRKILTCCSWDKRFIEYYEHITASAATLRGLLNFLGLAPESEENLQRWQSLKINESPALEMPEEIRHAAARELRPVYDYVFSNMAGEPPVQWLQDYNLGLPS